MTHAQPANPARPFDVEAVPTLGQDMVLLDVPQAVSLALDVRAAEKQALMALTEDLVQNLRPEIERLTADMVQKTLQVVWEKRSTDLDKA
jgi:hypothetical protein